MLATELKSLNHRHRALLSWLLANPHRQLREAAIELNLGRQYVSTVLHNDLFQAAYLEACKEQNTEAVFVGAKITEKLHALAHRSIDEIDRRLEENELESRELLTAAKLSLTALGYINPKGYSTDMHVHSHLQVDVNIINEARERALQRRQAPPLTIEANLEEQES
jgi:hypothetical protein